MKILIPKYFILTKRNQSKHEIYKYPMNIFECTQNCSSNGLCVLIDVPSQNDWELLNFNASQIAS